MQGTADLTLEPMAEVPVSGASVGTRLAVIRTGPDSALAIEARSATGNDRTTCTEGVLVYRIRNATPSGGGPVEVLDTHPDSDACWDRSVYPPLADAPLREGERFTVPGERIRIDVADRTRSGRLDGPGHHRDLTAPTHTKKPPSLPRGGLPPSVRRQGLEPRTR